MAHGVVNRAMFEVEIKKLLAIPLSSKNQSDTHSLTFIVQILEIPGKPFCAILYSKSLEPPPIRYNLDYCTLAFGYCLLLSHLHFKVSLIFGSVQFTWMAK